GFAETTDRMKKDGVALPAWVEKMRASNATGFYADGRIWDAQRGDYVKRETDAREVTWEVMRKGNAPVLKNAGAEAWDLGDGVLALTLKTKANSIDGDVVKMIHDSVERAERDFAAMIVWNQGEHFSVGANLFAVVMAAGQKQWDAIRELAKSYQYATQRMKYATVPVVAAPFGMPLA